MITKHYLEECFHADFENGFLIWKERPIHHFKNEQAKNATNTKFKGKIAGHKYATKTDGRFYRSVKIHGKRMDVHRIIWIMANNEWPNQIDHINGDGLDNRIENLRSVESFENHQNTRIHKRNKSGCTGVSRNNNKWRVRISYKNESIELGHFEDYKEAVKVRKEAEKKYGYHKNHGDRIR